MEELEIAGGAVVVDSGFPTELGDGFLSVSAGEELPTMTGKSGCRLPKLG
jgi:hypothetical protein